MVLLNGAATDDPDGSNLLLSEQWSQVAGPPVVLGNDDETVAYFRPTQTGRYRFRLDVSDGFDADSDACAGVERGALDVGGLLDPQPSARDNLAAPTSARQQQEPHTPPKANP